MITFILGVCAGVFADRVYPVPVSFVIAKAQALWAKATSKAPPSAP